MVVDVLIAGLNALKEYVALHVLTCLIPAFLLAGGIVTFVSREAIILQTVSQDNLPRFCFRPGAEKGPS